VKAAVTGRLTQHDRVRYLTGALRARRRPRTFGACGGGGLLVG
jgi:hypothetical protein